MRRLTVKYFLLFFWARRTQRGPDRPSRPTSHSLGLLRATRDWLSGRNPLCERGSQDSRRGTPSRPRAALRPHRAAITSHPADLRTAMPSQLGAEGPRRGLGALGDSYPGDTRPAIAAPLARHGRCTEAVTLPPCAARSVGGSAFVSYLRCSGDCCGHTFSSHREKKSPRQRAHE